MEYIRVPLSHKDVTYENVQVHPASSVINIQEIKELSSDFQMAQCVANSQAVASLLDLQCVEGFVYVFAAKDGEMSEYVIRHCWNCIGDRHFDVTAEYLWPDIDVTANEFYYYPVGYYNAEEYDFENGQIFLSDAVNIAKEINEELKKLPSDENPNIETDE